MANNIDISVFDNAQFREFARFAASASSGRTIVKVDATLQSKDGTPRTIVAKHGDFVWNFGRWNPNRTVNDEVRNLFKDTVLNMFGVKDTASLPPKVVEAMKLEDYGSGKPLTARRIIAVSKAIAAAIEPTNKVVTQEKAMSIVNDSVRYFDGKSPLPGGKLELDGDARNKAAQLLMDYGSDMTDTGLRILANYVVAAIASGIYKDGEVEAIASNMADYLKTARNFRPGDVRMASFDATMTKYWQDQLKDNLAPTETGKYDGEGVAIALQKDAERALFTIDGEVFRGVAAGARMISVFKNKITNPAHRKAISSFMNQNVGITYNLFASRSERLYSTSNFPALDMRKKKGFELFLSTDGGSRFFEGSGIMGPSRKPTYILEVDENATKAKLTVRNEGNIVFNIAKSSSYSTDWANCQMGNYVYEMEFEFDLTQDEPKITSSHIGQTIDVPVPDNEDQVIIETL